MKIITLLCMLLLSLSLCASPIKANRIDLWYETFGEANNPPLLLIMGGAGQGIIWPTDFCAQLARNGFYVIRYDQRDSGLSTCVDWEKNPYTLYDLAEDAIGLLDALNLQKAHLFGLSMGGPIAEIMANHFPDRVASIAIMASHFDIRPFNLAMSGLPLEPGLLSAPRESYMQAIEAIKKLPLNTVEEQVEQKYQAWQLLNGSVFPLDEKTTKEMLCHYIRRATRPENLLNYRKALRLSEELIKETHSHVKVPTIIFYGSEDPIIGPDHADAMLKAIAHSKIFYLEGMGHLPNPHFYEFHIKEIVTNSRESL